MTSPTGPGYRVAPRRRTFEVAPYEPGRTTAEAIAAGVLVGVEADDEVDALAAYAASRGLTVTGDPVSTMGGRRIRATLSDGREYVSRYLRAALAELLPPELLLEGTARSPIPGHAPAVAADVAPETSPAPSDAAEPPEQPISPDPPLPPEPPELLDLDGMSPADLARIRDRLQPLSWSIAAALWGVDGEAPEPVEAVADRLKVTPAFVRMVAASAIRLASDQGLG